MIQNKVKQMNRMLNKNTHRQRKIKKKEINKISNLKQINKKIKKMKIMNNNLRILMLLKILNFKIQLIQNKHLK